jgi:hypothetical protein
VITCVLLALIRKTFKLIIGQLGFFILGFSHDASYTTHRCHRAFKPNTMAKGESTTEKMTNRITPYINPTRASGIAAINVRITARTIQPSITLAILRLLLHKGFVTLGVLKHARKRLY